jgi:predicted transcriptional regulator
MAKKRYCLYLSRPLAHQLERVASLRHGSKSALLEEALRKSLEPEQVPGVEEGLVRRLNELHKALAARCCAPPSDPPSPPRWPTPP